LPSPARSTIPGRAAALATVLLGLTMLAFYLQQRWIGKLSYVTVTGKGDGGLPGKLPKPLVEDVLRVAGLWIFFTLVCYAVIFVGGFVKDIGRGDMTPSFAHFLAGFGIAFDNKASIFVGSAWDSLFTTIEVAAISAPFTAAIGLLAAYVITRHRFVGRRAFEFLTLVSFAIPGTVIGVSYIVAFNVGTARADRRHGDPRAVLRVPQHAGGRARGRGRARADRQDARRSIVDAARVDRAHVARGDPAALRPAILATLVFSFTHAMTAVSAVIFLATAKYNLATVTSSTASRRRVSAGHRVLCRADSRDAACCSRCKCSSATRGSGGADAPAIVTGTGN
jgi:iron(III) transport system permease protein